MQEPESRDPFAEIVGRALIEPGYRDTLITGSDQDKISALIDAGLTQAQAKKVLPLLDKATSALNDLAGDDAFGVRITAA
jgi:hypothetical protein